MSETVQRKIRRVIGDAYSFVRSREVNRAIQAVTFTQVLQEQILRNGDTERSNKSQYNPYSYMPGETEPASQQPLSRANFLSGTDTNNPTKIDQVLALKNEIGDMVEQVKNLPVEEVTGDALEDTRIAEAILTTATIEDATQVA